MDRTEIYLYGEDIRLRRVFLSETLDIIAQTRGFSAKERDLFAYPAMLAAALASDIKDDDGSVFVSLKTPKDRLSYTAVCETDGRLRGYVSLKEPDPLTDGECLLTVGRRLAVRGDYTSTVAAETPEKAAREYFKNSAQTKAEMSFVTGKEASLILAEYLPGHDVNTEAAAEEIPEDRINELAEAVKIAKKCLDEEEKAEKYAEIPVIFGCTCSKRKLHTLLEQQGIEIKDGLEAECRFCGKKYVF